MRTYERSKYIKTVAISSMVTLMLAACGESREDVRGHIDDPATRIDYDFGGSNKFRDLTGPDESGNYCLVETPYDPISDKPALLTTEFEDGSLVAILTPPRDVYPDAPNLRLEGFENTSEFLQPADESSRSILENYGCIEN